MKIIEIYFFNSDNPKEHLVCENIKGKIFADIILNALNEYSNDDRCYRIAADNYILNVKG